VRYYQVDFIDAWKRVAMAAQDGDFDTFKKRFPDLGMTPKPKKLDWEAQWDAMLQLYTPMRTRAPFFTFTHAYVEESYGKLVFDNPNKLKLAMPAEWLLLNRLQWGLFAVLSHLGSTAPWPDMFRAALEAPTRQVHLADQAYRVASARGGQRPELAAVVPARRQLELVVGAVVDHVEAAAGAAQVVAQAEVAAARVHGVPALPGPVAAGSRR
jgi:hypothetical protein